jgi:hypothetical protein
MSSPFPGMDPYLEAPHVWPGFHHKFASELSTELNGVLPVPYYAELEMRPELGIVEQEEERQRVVPDVTVVRHPNLPKAQGGDVVAVLELPRRSISPSIDTAINLGKIRHYFVEIRDPSQGHKLITLIEIVTPVEQASRAGPRGIWIQAARGPGERRQSDRARFRASGPADLTDGGPQDPDQDDQVAARLPRSHQPGLAAHQFLDPLSNLSRGAARMAALHSGATQAR